MIDFINAWERKEEIIEICKNAKACIYELKYGKEYKEGTDISSPEKLYYFLSERAE